VVRRLSFELLITTSVTASCEDIVIPAHGKGIAATGLSIAVPSGCYGRVGERRNVNLRANLAPNLLVCVHPAPRSGLAVKHFIDVGAGVIDADYRGPVGVVLFNFSTVDFAS
jgi:dUTP pyrophosphatase